MTRTSWIWLLLLYGRSRKLHAAVAWCVVVGVLAALTPTSLPLLLQPGQAELRTADLIGVVPVMLLCGKMEIGLSDAEQVARRTLIACRCLHVLLLVIASAAFVAGTLWWRLPLTESVGGVLNAAAFIGMAGAVARGTVPVWLAPALVTGVTYLMGTGSSGSARPWAWLLFPDTSAVKVAIDIGLFLAGAGLWTVSRSATQS